jgi:hypothetical protein
MNSVNAKRLYKTLPIGPCVYVVGFRDYVKIGSSKDLNYRLQQLHACLPGDLTIYATLAGHLELEQQLHERFSTYRLQREWFRKAGELAAWIDGGCKL